MSTIHYDLDAATGVATLTFDAPGADLNTMSEDWMADWARQVERLVAERAQLKGVILASAKKTFFAGADLKQLLAAWPVEPDPAFERMEALKRDLRRLETLGLPVVACLGGSALGGGFELALTAHHRIAVDDPRVQLGCPEVTLGLLPGAGGVVKLVRLLGLQAAMPYVLEGKLMSPAQALEAGLVHQLVPAGPGASQGLRDAALAWIAAHPQSAQPWDQKSYRMPGGTPSHPKIAQLLPIAPAMLRAKTRGLYPAAEVALACMVEGASVDVDTALRLETRAFVGLLASPVARNLIQVFFDRSLAKSGASRPAGVPPWKASRVGVLGAGMMGAGIAFACARRGVAVVLKDVTLERAEAGKDYSRKLTERRVKAGRMTAEQQAALLELIHTTGDANALTGCDLIIEAVPENRSLKNAVTREAEPLLADGGIFATNTSTLPISGLAEASSAPDRFIGLHFFSPVDKMELVEIIVGRETSPATLARAHDFVHQIGKLPIVAHDSRGFFTSRTFGTFVKEGAHMLCEGIPAPVIERAALAAGLPVGPLAVADEVSQTLIVSVMEQTRRDLQAEGKPVPRDEADDLVERLFAEFGRKGRAHGGGYYDYPADGPKTLWPGLKAFEKPGAAWTLADLSERFLMRQALETLRCMVEGVVGSAHDANLGSIFGIGFPAWTGGAYQYIENLGLDQFLTRASELAQRHGERFQPPVLPTGWKPGLPTTPRD